MTDLENDIKIIVAKVAALKAEQDANNNEDDPREIEAEDTTEN